MTEKPNPSPSPQPSAPRPPDRTARIALTIVALLVLASVAAGVALWRLQRDRVRITDDAQVAAPSRTNPAGIVVIARFKQQDAAAIRVGQAALVRLAQAPDTPVPGRVAAVGGETDPSAPAPGSFVQIAQRQPVRIAVDAAAAERTLFVQGMAARVQVDTRSEP